jgi:coproporphyrinogen III oxidase-like Fe-S oxidoreductase
MTALDTRHRLQEFFYYPKLSAEEDRVTDQDSFATYLRDDAVSEPDSFIYVHIPFCDYLCHFCPFYKTLNQTTPAEVKEAFVSSLIREIEIYASAPLTRRRAIHWIEFGGGTPTSLSTDQLCRILGALYANFNLDRCEFITLESEALTLQDTGKLRSLKKLGLNRVSFGVQTFKEPLRRKLGLKPAVRDLYAAAESIRAAGIAEFAVDLLYSLPDQSVDELALDAESVLSLEPDYVDTYLLTLWEGSRFKEQIAEGKTFATRPSDQDSVAMFQIILDRMASANYQPIHSFTFGRGERRYTDNIKRHILNDGDMIGLGPSARGHIGSRQYSNVASVDEYIALLSAGKLPVGVGMEVSPAERAHRLMVMFPSMLLRIAEEDIPASRGFADTISEMAETGYLSRAGGEVAVTSQGLIWAGNISRLFFSPEQKAKMTRAHLFSLRNKLNPYNQDLVGITKGRPDLRNAAAR